MSQNEEIIQSAIIGGLIGASLGALINKKDGGAIGALAGAVLLATVKANENAKKTNVPVLIKENDSIYEINANGEKRFIKTIQHFKRNIPQTFKLQ
jgi:outer membrane lipoprotein SlyB